LFVIVGPHRRERVDGNLLRDLGERGAEPVFERGRNIVGHAITSFRKRASAREANDLTVPGAQFNAAAISASLRPS
jgi:hypothetical protein